MNQTPETVRLDVWLWRARFFKTRSLAMNHITKKGVRITRHGITRKVKKPAVTITSGDDLTWVVEARVFTLKVEKCGERRGPAPEAQELYSIIDLDGTQTAG